MDIQGVFNYYKAISYVCSYFSKPETQSSETMKKVALESQKANLSVRQTMKKITSAFSCCREVSIQEAVTLVLPELWLHKSFPQTVFVDTSIPEKRFQMCKTEKEISELHPESNDVFKRYNLDRYVNRPNSTVLNG